MKLLDANVLLYAYDSASAHHAACAAWLEAALAEDEPVGVPWQTSLAFVRIATNPRAVRQPLGIEDACGIVTALIERPGVIVVEPGERFWVLFRQLVTEARVHGPLVTDAVLAALALEQGAAVCTTDRDFRRFAGLSVIDPSA
ncbi:MAG: PIN domain-containing protein [Proteobacteria bacterium]|nr:PIN domain-containing protein [Pseudomonadota bacterium]